MKPFLALSSSANMQDEAEVYRLAVRLTCSGRLGGDLRLFGVAIGLAVGGEKVIDDVRAVIVSDGANPSHSAEGEWSDELAERQFPVEVVKFGLCFRAGEYGVKWLTVLVNDSGP